MGTAIVGLVKLKLTFGPGDGDYPPAPSQTLLPRGSGNNSCNLRNLRRVAPSKRKDRTIENVGELEAGSSRLFFDKNRCQVLGPAFGFLVALDLRAQRTRVRVMDNK
jgi:hypothetical protein